MALLLSANDSSLLSAERTTYPLRRQHRRHAHEALRFAELVFRQVPFVGGSRMPTGFERSGAGKFGAFCHARRRAKPGLVRQAWRWGQIGDVGLTALSSSREFVRTKAYAASSIRVTVDAQRDLTFLALQRVRTSRTSSWTAPDSPTHSLLERACLLRARHAR